MGNIFIYNIVLYFTEAIMACENTKEDYIHKQMGKWLAMHLFACPETSNVIT